MELEDRILRFYERTNSLAEYGSGADESPNNITRKITVFDPDIYPERIDQYSMYDIIQPPQEIQAWTVAAVLAIESKRSERKYLGESELHQQHDPIKREIENAILENIKK